MMGLGLTRAFQAVALGFVAAVSLAGMAAPAAVDFTFRFTNFAQGGGEVTGIVWGLTNDDTSAAGSVEVLTNTVGFGIGKYVGEPVVNILAVVNGALLDLEFWGGGFNNTAPDLTEGSLRFDADPTFGIILAGLSGSGVSVASQEGTGLAFTLLQPAVIPLPATAWLLLGAMGGLAGLSRRRRRKAT